MKKKINKLIILGLISSTLVNISYYNIQTNAIGTNMDYNSFLSKPNNPSIVVEDDIFKIIDNGVNTSIIDDFKSDFSFNYSNPLWSTTGGVMRSEIIGNNNSTENTFSVSAIEGDVLNIKGIISSEANYDIGTIILNGNVIYEGSGNRIDFNISEPLQVGENTITLRYEKDGADSYYEDCMFINSISVISTQKSKNIQYRIDSGEWVNYTNEISLDYSKQDSYVIEAKAIGDNNIESNIEKRIASKMPITVNSPSILNKINGFSIKDNQIETFSLIEDFKNSISNISYSNNAWVIGNGVMISENITFGDITNNVFNVYAKEGDILTINGSVFSDLLDEVANIYVNEELVFSTVATNSFSFEHSLREGFNSIKLEYKGTYGSQPINSMQINDITISTKLNSEIIQYKIDNGEWINYNTPISLDFDTKESYSIQSRAIYDNKISSITSSTINKNETFTLAPSINVNENIVNIVDNGTKGILLYDDFAFNSDFNYYEHNFEIKNNQFNSPILSYNGESAILEFDVNLDNNAVLNIFGSQNSLDINDFVTVYIDGKSIYRESDNVFNVEGNLNKGYRNIRIEFSKYGDFEYLYKGIIDLISISGTSTSKEILYKIDDGNWIKYDNTIELDFSDNNEKTLYAKAIGHNGIESEIVSKVIQAPITTEPENQNKTTDLNVSINSKNVLEVSLSTNTISFEEYNGIIDVINDDLNINVTSALNYDISATLNDYLINDNGDIMDINILNIKESNSNKYKPFSGINNELLLIENYTAGRNNIHNINLKLVADSSVKAGTYKSTISFEINQK